MIACSRGLPPRGASTDAIVTLSGRPARRARAAQALQPEEIDTNALVLNHIGFLKRTVGPSIEVKTELADDTFPVHADPSQLKCALMNLVVNARDAMPNGGILTVRTCNAVLDGIAGRTDTPFPAGDYAVIEVSDTGIGISPENLQRIFEPFFTTKEVGKGSGPGLRCSGSSGSPKAKSLLPARLAGERQSEPTCRARPLRVRAAPRAGC